MRFVDNRNITDPRRNLALEEYLLRHVRSSEPLLLFYINEPSVIIGRNQNTLQEIDPDYVREHNIHVVRRLSGGGAVYHDLGNLNFSFVTEGQQHIHDFARFTEPVIAVLRDMGVDAELRGRSDIFAAGKKISGNAQFASGGRMFSHGTLLFDTDLETMLKAINPRQVKIESKAVQSIRNYVTNICELLPRKLHIEEFKQALLHGIFNSADVPLFELSAADWERVEETAENRYMTWAWNVGRSPRFNVQKSERFASGKVEARIDVDEGKIRTIKFYGDFASRRDVGELEDNLIGVRYDPEALQAALEDIEIAPYFGDIEQEQLLQLLY